MYVSARRECCEDGGEEDGGRVWKLNDAQFEKLRMLTVATVVRDHVEGTSSSSSSDDVVCGGTTGGVAMGGGEGGGGGGKDGRGGGANNADIKVRMAAFKIRKCDVGKGVVVKDKPDSPFREYVTSMKKKTTTKKKKKSVASYDKSNVLSIPYSLLANELHIPRRYDDDFNNDPPPSSINDVDYMRKLEDVLIQCVYSSIVAVRLDQASRTMKIMSHVSLSMNGTSGDDGGGIDRGAFSSSSSEGGGTMSSSSSLSGKGAANNIKYLPSPF